MRYVFAVVAVFTCSSGFPSEPGQPLDCSDWVFMEPGIYCESVIAECPQSGDNQICQNSPGRPVDGDGSVLMVRVKPLPFIDCGSGMSPEHQIEVARLRNGVQTTVATLSDRCGAGGTIDRAYSIGSPDGHAGFDPNFGRLYLGVSRSCTQNGATPPCPYLSGTWQLQRLAGFTTTFEILQSFTPLIGFRVPFMPEGMVAADHFDTYTGPLANPISFATAQPLACGYPTTAPQVGDYLSVADPLPDPAPGTGRYYVTSATYQGVTRYGRQTINHITSGRSPAALPSCAP